MISNIITNFPKLSELPAIFHRETSQAKLPPPPNVNMTLINSWIFIYYLVSDVYKVTGHDRSRSSENRHCALDISPNVYQIFTKGSSLHVARFT